jgi:hypothetical protein
VGVGIESQGRTLDINRKILTEKESTMSNDIKTMSLVELKAVAYDHLANIEQSKNGSLWNI